MALPEGFAALAGVALFLAAGAGLAELLPALRRMPLAHRLGFAYPLGVAWTAGGLFALSHALAVPVARPAAIGLAGLPAAAGLTRRIARAFLYRKGRLPAPGGTGDGERELPGETADPVQRAGGGVLLPR